MSKEQITPEQVFEILQQAKGIWEIAEEVATFVNSKYGLSPAKDEAIFSGEEIGRIGWDKERGDFKIELSSPTVASDEVIKEAYEKLREWAKPLLFAGELPYHEHEVAKPALQILSSLTAHKGQETNTSQNGNSSIAVGDEYFTIGGGCYVCKEVTQSDGSMYFPKETIIWHWEESNGNIKIWNPLSECFKVNTLISGVLKEWTKTMSELKERCEVLELNMTDSPQLESTPPAKEAE